MSYIGIDQNNHKERGHQVQQMASIYHEAELVIIWLGISTYNTDLIMDVMKQLEKESIKYTSDNWKTSDQGWGNIWSLINQGHNSRLTSRKREGLVSLLNRSWFNRVWILQEVANARVAEIICGTKSVSAHIFALTPSLAEIVPSLCCQAVLDIMPGPSRESSWWIQKRDLQTLLTKFGKSEASDPRDNIYALLGMSSDVSNSDILRADYEKSVEEAIQDTTSFLLRLHDFDYPPNSLPGWTLQEFLQNVDSLDNAFLQWAGEMGYEEVVKLLVERGDFDINKKDKSYQSPLLNAAKRGQRAIVWLLINGGADVNTKNKQNETALYNAAFRGHSAVVQMLINAGADVNAKNEQKETALYGAAFGGRNAIVKLLINAGADVNVKDKQNKTPLHKAASRGHDAVLRLLIEGGADIDAEDDVGSTALYYAVLHGKEAAVRILVKSGANINVKDTIYKAAPLHKAVFKKNHTMVQLLVDLGADINVKDICEGTALHRVVFKECWTIVKLLVNSGADVNTENKYGKTALDMAALKGNREIVEMLGSARAFQQYNSSQQ